PARVGPFQVHPYLEGLFVFVLPNLFLTGAIFFCIATLTRSLVYTYAGVVVFFVGFTIAGVMLDDLDNRAIGALVDPYGIGAFELMTRYWTVSEKNAGSLSLTGVLLQNRLLWVGVALLILAFTYVRFRFTTVETGKARRRRLLMMGADAAPEASRPAAPARADGRVPAARHFTPATAWKQFLRQTRLETLGAVGGLPFLVMLFFGLLNLVGNSLVLDERFGTPVYAVTHLMLRITAGGFGILIFLILTFYSGEMVWRERTLRMSELVDAMPVPSWVLWASKLAALATLVLVLHAAAMLTTIGIQIYRGYTNFEIPLYLKGLFLVSAPPFLFQAALCLFVHAVANNKFLGWLVSTAIYLTGRVLPAMRLEHHLYRFGTAPDAPYSDMNGFGHFVQPLIWFSIYWALMSAALVAVAHLLWVRGTDARPGLRLRVARQRLGPGAALALTASLAGAAATGAYIYYNTNILNRYLPAKARLDRQAEFEKRYRQYETLRGPRVTAIEADVDIRPEIRRVDIRGHYAIRNKTEAPVEVVHLYVNPDVSVRDLSVRGAHVEMTDGDLGYRIYRFDRPLLPGDESQVDFDLSLATRGFVNDDSITKVVENGTFIESVDYFPHLGYPRINELIDPNERRKRSLSPVQRFPKIDDAAARLNSYVSNEADWVRFATTVSTSPDQIAIAPGYLTKEWRADGRRYFRYEMDAPIFDFFAYQSGRYAVKRDRWNDVAIEIYYHPGHPYNVDRMIAAVKRSLDYFTANFSPFQHRQVRIIEFPRYASFASSYPNTIPFSESIGFIARLDEDPEAIDYVSYVTAHEVAHQWWGHQVMSGNVQGATLMVETMAQYSALMVMEKEFGPERMRRFLKYELDNYLRGRGGELIEEQPLYLVENQPYIHYRKGSLVMYALRDLVGAEPLNRALAAYVKAVAFQEPPYTYSKEFLDYVREAVPSDRLSLIDDLFRSITLYENRATSATWVKRGDGRYVVRLEIASAKYHADGSGQENLVALDDWVDVGVFGDKEKDAPPEGKVLLLEKRRLDKPEDVIELVVDQEPRKAGIDPFNKLIDRNPDDNIVAVTAGGEAAPAAPRAASGSDSGETTAPAAQESSVPGTR
ncbi:MAG TPA: M1 family aminopeptidase, partial [Candidatus Cryosericum sp.]|nr:M1 family aminopeptidase [Candidatus Cryosericum sp.]